MSPDALVVGARVVVSGPLPGGERIGDQAAQVVGRWTDAQGSDCVRVRMTIDGFEIEYAAALLASQAEPISEAVAEAITTKLGRLT